MCHRAELATSNLETDWFSRHVLIGSGFFTLTDEWSFASTTYAANPKDIAADIADIPP
jgi:hypothetical protein